MGRIGQIMKEARRRRVFRVAALYIVAAWVIVQVAGAVFSGWGIPESAIRYVWYGAALGFPLVLIFSWYYDVTEQGIVRTPPAHPNQLVDLSLHKADFIILSALTIIVGVVTYGLIEEILGSEELEQPAVVTREIPEHSVAVLPFVNLSGDPEQEYFSDGISEELLNALARLTGLHVPARTSSFYFKDKNEKIEIIGEQLGVRTVLEGSVRMAGDQVRITAQLVNASDGYHLWSESYDRELTTNSIFSIQREIAEEIANALQTTLTPVDQSRLRSVRTENLEAYIMYLAGRNNLNLRRLENMQQARKQFEQAIDLDPNYAQAYSGLSDSVMLILSNHTAISTDEAFDVAEQALKKALALDSNDADIHASYGLYQMELWYFLGDESARNAAEEAFKRAIEINPNHAQAWQWRASPFDDTDVDKSIEYLERAGELNPLARMPQLNLGISYAKMGRNDAALAQWLKTIDLHPDWPNPNEWVASHLLGMGKLDEALAWLDKATAISADPLFAADAIRIYLDFGEQDRALGIINDVPSEHPWYLFEQAFAKKISGDYAGSIAMMETVIAQMDRPPLSSY